MKEEGRRSRWNIRPGTTIAFLAVVGLLEAWALRAADPDFPLPDFFHGFVLALVGLFALSAAVQSRPLRTALTTLVFALPLGVLLFEVLGARSDAAQVADRIAVSDDLLLRYAYRPGAVVQGGPGGQAPLAVTPDGFLDVAHAVPKPPGVFRVVVLGDSVPNDLSIPFEKRFPKRLEALVAAGAPPGKRTEVLNVSCEGYNTIQEVRLLETRGLRYQPDLVVVAYVLNDPFLQNGGYRRVGNSFFAFRLVTFLPAALGRSSCGLFTGIHSGYGFDLVVRSSFERLRLLSRLHGFRVAVATIPLVERFDDPDCLACYDKVLGVAREQGFETLRLVDGFRGEDHRRFLKRGDPTHPNAAGHERIARQMSDAVLAMSAKTAPAN